MTTATGNFNDVVYPTDLTPLPGSYDEASLEKLAEEGYILIFGYWKQVPQPDEECTSAGCVQQYQHVIDECKRLDVILAKTDLSQARLTLTESAGT